MRRFLADNSFSLFFFAILIAALVGQAVAGHGAHNEDAVQHGSPEISLGRYVLSSEFGQAMLENWESEYLQFSLFLLATIFQNWQSEFLAVGSMAIFAVYLRARGASESKGGHPARDDGRVQLSQ